MYFSEMEEFVSKLFCLNNNKITIALIKESP